MSRFRGRTEEQDRFRTVLDRIKPGRHPAGPSYVMLILATGGMGKSTLLERYAQIIKEPSHRRAFTCVRLNWEDVRDEHPNAYPSSTGAQLLPVLIALHHAVGDAAGSSRRGRRRVTRAFEAYRTVVSMLPQMAAELEQRQHEAAASRGAVDAEQLAQASARFAELTPVGPLAPAIRQAPQAARLVRRLARRRRGRRAEAQQIETLLDPEKTLLRAFASGLRRLAKDRPVALLVDTCEILASSNRWLRDIAAQTGDGVVWALAARMESGLDAAPHGDLAGFQRHFPEDRLRIVQLSPFGESNVGEMLIDLLGTDALGEGDVSRIVTATHGIPMAVEFVADALRRGDSIEEALRPVTAEGDSSLVVRSLAERYLVHVRVDAALGPDLPRLYGLALLYGPRHDVEVLRALWGQLGDVGVALEQLAGRHDFVLTGSRRLHGEVRDTIRSYLLDSVRRAEIAPRSEAAAEVLFGRLAATGLDTVEAQLDSEGWRAAAAATVWYSFWADNESGLRVLCELYPAAALRERAFADELVEIAEFFAHSLTSAQRSVLRGLAALAPLSFRDAFRRARGSIAAARQRWRARTGAEPAGETASEADIARAVEAVSSAHGGARLLLAGDVPRETLSALLEARHYVPDDPDRALERLESAGRGLPAGDGFLSRAAATAANSLASSYLFPKRDALRPQEGRRAAELATRYAPQDASSWNYLGIARRHLRSDTAARAYERALELEPGSAAILGNYASFLHNVGKDHPAAEEHYQRAIDADPNHANNLGNYALFLHNIGKDHPAAEEHYQRAIDADPNNANNLGNYAVFLKNVRKDHPAAEEHYQRAIDADPNHANNLGNYALFLHNVGKDHPAAEEHYQRAIDADPNNAHSLGNYAGFLFLLDRRNEALDMERRAREQLDPATQQPLELELWFYVLCYEPSRRDEAISNVRSLLVAGVTSGGFDLSAHVEKAAAAGHPDHHLIETAARVIAGNADPSGFDPT